MMMTVQIPCAAGNRAIGDGTIGKTIEGFAAEFKPEAMYFVAEGGDRTAYLVFDMKDTTYIPLAAERFFSGLEARICMRPAMNLDDLRAGLGRLAK
jgi:hypothetical protein